MEEGRINDRMIIRRNGNELKTELKRIRTQIIKLQKKQLGQKDKIAFAHYRISYLDNIIVEIHSRHKLIRKIFRIMPPIKTSTSVTSHTLATINNSLLRHYLALTSSAARRKCLLIPTVNTTYWRSPGRKNETITFSTSMVRKEQLASFAGLSGLN
ncbi:hypothetical protein Tco_0667524 [Tanacetum coccineum]